jgi:hypothetical protein
MSILQIVVLAVVATLVWWIIAKRRPTPVPTLAVSPSTPYGEALSSRVADRLERGDALSYRHRDYCGVGVRFAEPQYIYGEAFDGVVLTPDDLRASGTNPANIEHVVFHSRAEFVAWLAAQSDESLSGNDSPSEWLRGNQRITRARLESFARGERMPDV